MPVLSWKDAQAAYPNQEMLKKMVKILLSRGKVVFFCAYKQSKIMPEAERMLACRNVSGII